MKVDRWVTRIVMFVAKVMYVAMGLSVFLQVVFRYGFNMGLNWVDEFSRSLLVWVAFLGAGFAIGNIESTCVGFVRDALPPRVQKALTFLFRILILVLLAVLVQTGLIFAELGGYMRTVAMWGLTMYIPHLAIPVGSAVMIFKWLVTMLKDFFPEAGLVDGEKAS